LIHVRRWSDHVVAEYADDGNPLGGYLLRIVDTRETFVAQAILWDVEPAYGYDDDAPGESATATKRPAGLDPDDLDRSPWP
jgi:hypothetical protein